ncbi:hypothetical protein BC938DRAFT_477997 [Jimgerdemannia flammicorona]|uniref:Uncharacterized protein n=1 Tax=Jimgerdemannia flammicorona TaxID=994334 RepID=A0A433QNL3_9FUNG|nr:hypothetical protein BC938DRAFT_477997 [Jimgerdemannia flammicorona]
MLRDVTDEIIRDDKLFSNYGWTDLNTLVVRWGLGWGDDEKFDSLSARNYINVVTATRPQITAALGIGEDEYDEVARIAIQEMSSENDYRQHVTLYSRFGRKSLEN